MSLFLFPQSSGKESQLPFAFGLRYLHASRRPCQRPCFWFGHRGKDTNRVGTSAACETRVGLVTLSNRHRDDIRSDSRGKKRGSSQRSLCRGNFDKISLLYSKPARSLRVDFNPTAPHRCRQHVGQFLQPRQMSDRAIKECLGCVRQEVEWILIHSAIKLRLIECNCPGEV